MTIKLFYIKSGNNFGDILSKYIVEMISGDDVVHSKAYKSDLISTGSLFSKIEKTKFRRFFFRIFRPTYIWGTGINSEGGKLSKLCLRISAVRGKQTADRLGLKHGLALGDPALLCSYLFPQSTLSAENSINKKYLATPHLEDKNNFIWVEKVKKILGEDVEICDLSQDITIILEKIAGAKAVITSAMHPLIVSHSYGVPVVWIDVGHPTVLGGDYKFKDYYSALNLEAKSIRLDNIISDNISKQDLLNHFKSSILDKNYLKKIQKDLLGSFPEKLIKRLI